MSAPMRCWLVLAVLVASTDALLLSPVLRPAVGAVCRVASVSMAAVQETEATSFVQTEMRSAAMKLHTRDQSREGKQQAQTPVQQWEPQRKDYLQFLVDSRHVYHTFEEIVASTDILAPFRNSGLERTEALDMDIAWFGEQGEQIPEVGEPGAFYAEKVRGMAEAGEWERFVCHFYNFYFAHTAGGSMIGKMMSNKLLDGYTLNFYQWPAGDVKQELLPALREKIDAMVSGWTREQKDACLKETAESFQGGGGLLAHIRGPSGTNVDRMVSRGPGGTK